MDNICQKQVSIKLVVFHFLKRRYAFTLTFNISFVFTRCRLRGIGQLVVAGGLPGRA